MAQRITCDEEERQRFGYRLVTSYSFPQIGGRVDRRDAEVTVNGEPAMQLSYGDAVNLYRINLGWATQKPGETAGYWLDLERGYWGRNQADDQDQAGDHQHDQFVAERVVGLDQKLAVQQAGEEAGVGLEAGVGFTHPRDPQVQQPGRGGAANAASTFASLVSVKPGLNSGKLIVIVCHSATMKWSKAAQDPEISGKTRPSPENRVVRNQDSSP